MSTARTPTRQERWRARNPVAAWAHRATRSAIRAGLIVPQACEECGADKAEAHHPQYDRPLAVNWLCRLCHKAAHRRQRSGGEL